MTIDLIDFCASIGRNDTVDLTLMSSIEVIFKSLSCMNGSFLLSNGEHNCCSTKNHGVNLSDAQKAFAQIQKMENTTLKTIVSV